MNIPKHNVYVIGSMGVGKSCFLNFMLNLGEVEIFKTGRTGGSVTKKVQTESYNPSAR